MNKFPSQRRKCLSLESCLGPSNFWGNSPHLQPVVDRINLHLATFHLRTTVGTWDEWISTPTPKWRLGKFHLKQRTQNSRHHDFGMEPDSVSFRECISKMPGNFIGVVYFILRQSLALHEILQMWAGDCFWPPIWDDSLCHHTIELKWRTTGCQATIKY